MKIVDNLKEKFEDVDPTEIIAKSVLPAIITFGLGFALCYVLIGGKNNSTVQSFTEAQATEILSTQDLPTQISELTNNQLKVLENQIANLGIETTSEEKEDSLVSVLSQINADNKFNDFFKSYLSADYSKSATTIYQTLKGYLAESFKGDNVDLEDSGYIIQQNFFNLWNGRSWAKDTGSQTAMAGNVLTSVLSGTTNNNRYYQVVVPATNTERDFALLNFIVKTNNENKIIAVSYTGVLEGKDINDYYKQVSDLLNNKTTDLPTDYSSLPSLKVDKEEAKDDEEKEAKDTPKTETVVVDNVDPSKAEGGNND